MQSSTEPTQSIAPNLLLSPIHALIRMSSNELKKVILVIGGTGAQGLAVVDGLQKPSEDGSPSPYQVRVMTRDPEHPRSKKLAESGVEVVKGMSPIVRLKL